MRASPTLIALWLAGCGVHGVVEGTRGPADAPCEGLQLHVADGTTQCADANCRFDSTDIEIAFTNCSAHAVRVQRLELRHRRGTTVYEFPFTALAPGESRRRQQTVYGSGAFEIRAFALGEIAYDAFFLRNPEREAALEACTACDGDWGPMGMGQHIGCNCRTSDAGQACRASDECEGACVYAGTRQLSEAPPGTPACTRWVMVGVCSERTHVYGCRAYLREPRYSCRRPLRTPYRCVD